jgi:hypothetical protein
MPLVSVALGIALMLLLLLALKLDAFFALLLTAFAVGQPVAYGRHAGELWCGRWIAATRETAATAPRPGRRDASPPSPMQIGLHTLAGATP